MPATTIAFAWPVFILTGRAAAARCAAQAPALTLSLDQRWRHCGHTGYPPVGPTGRVPRLFYFIYFFRIRRRAHARATCTHVYDRPSGVVVRRTRTVLYTYVHVSARIPLRVCVRRSLSHFSFWRYAPPPLAFIIHTTSAIAS